MQCINTLGICMSNNDFKQKLLIGNNFEVEIVQPFLIDTFSGYWLEATHDHKVGNYAGPKLYNKTRRPLTMPDFRLTSVTDNTDIILFEAKYKTKVFSIAGEPGIKFAAIEEYKCMQYAEAARVLGARLMYIFGIEQTNGLYILPPDAYIPHVFNNEHSNGVIRAFIINEQYRVGDIE